MTRLAGVAIWSAFILPVAAWGQASNTTVRGSVRDQAQAIIPGAKVTLTNTSTNVVRETLTNEAGLFVFPGVIPGPYRIGAEFSGMQRFEGALQVQLQQDATIDMVLQVAQAVTTVEVRDLTPVLKTDSPSLGHVLERQRIEQLPINGRGYQNLLVTVPGITWSTHGHGVGGRVQGYGLLTGTNMIVFDGAPMNEVYEGWDVARTPGLDALQEINVEVNNASAKFSRPTTVVMSSRSGTNAFHGNVFHTNRNSAYGVARRREDYYVKPPYLNRNEYGVSAGGPVYIPKAYDGRNRTFWFFAWEGVRYMTHTTQRYAVPTEAMRNGDFRGLIDAQGRQFNLYDPFTTDTRSYARQPLAYRGVPNTIDPARLSPVAKFLFGVTKMPTHPQINPLVDNNWIGPSPRLLEQDSYNLRIDHRISDRDHLFGRFSIGTHYEEYSAQNAIFERINGMKVVQTTNRWWPSHTLSTTWLHTFSPTTTNELLVTGTRDFHRRGAGDFQTDYAAMLGLPNPFNARNWTVVSDIGLGNYNPGGENPYYLISTYLTIQDNATKIVGKHEFQFGLHYRFEDVTRNLDSVAGNFSAGTLGTALYDPASTPTNPIARPFTGHNMANLYLGLLNYNATFRRPWVFMRRKEYAPYVQDNWKVTPRLTLNLGLRYEFRTPLRDRNDLLMSFDFDRHAYVIGTDRETFIRRGATLPQVVSRFEQFGGRIIDYNQAGLPRELAHRNWRNFGPRLGFAYRGLDGRKSFVLRGGYRLSYYTTPITNWFTSQSTPQLVSTSFQNSVTNTALSPDGLPNYGLRTVPRYVAGVNTPSSIIDINDTRLVARGFTAVHIDPKLNDPRVHDWNFTIEKEIMASTVVRLAYVGNHTGKVQQTVNFNDQVGSYIWYATRRQPLPTGEFASVATRPYDQQVYGTVNGYYSTGFTNYNGFQVELERRYNNGLGFQIFYVTGNVLAATAEVSDTTEFLPGTVPTDIEARNRFLNYARDITAPKHQVRWNWILDLPFGRGRRLGGNASGLVDKLIGGWQIAATGSWRTNYWNLPTEATGYPTGNPIEIYGYKYPIEDCRSGVCFPGYLYWNGYIPANRINSVDAQGRPNGVMGVPANYKPAIAPLIPWGSTALPANAPANTRVQDFWDTNTVWVPLNNGTVQRIAYNDGLHPWRNQRLPGVRQWFQDASLFKFINITERVQVRFNIDFFNVLNVPNDPNAITGDGILSTRNSGSAARVTQLGLRLSW
jgi:hypothetical protein